MSTRAPPHRRRWIALGLVGVATLAALGLGLAARWRGAAPAPIARGDHHWPPPARAAAAVHTLRDACRQAARGRRRLLVEFSAPWCEHCGAVAAALGDTALQERLPAFQYVVLNIGDDDELHGVRRQLGARAIPYWGLFEPERCDAPFESWSRIASTHPRGDPAAMAAWLDAHGG